MFEWSSNELSARLVPVCMGLRTSFAISFLLLALHFLGSIFSSPYFSTSLGPNDSNPLIGRWYSFEYKFDEAQNVFGIIGRSAWVDENLTPCRSIDAVTKVLFCLCLHRFYIARLDGYGGITDIAAENNCLAYCHVSTTMSSDVPCERFRIVSSRDLWALWIAHVQASLGKGGMNVD
ncbi:hypothetical protein F5050DRAFT_318605 [Lentinula boryana]|uniref:Uncharacterized protein n=1 Tax=Lentinula boryana TaxID=40481 RepID=A0ABQ8QA48_9AGAR|nr:hypothetical protein F5050DRAFT_318605 [Lentinula boryana]